MTAENTPAAELSWRRWAGQGGHGCDRRTARGDAARPIPSHPRGAVTAGAPAQRRGRTSPAPAALTGGFSAPLGWRRDSQRALQLQSFPCIQTEFFLLAVSARCFLLGADGSFPPCSIPLPEGPGYLPAASAPRACPIPARQPLRMPGVPQTSGRSRCPWPCSRSLLPTSVTGQLPKRGLFTGETVAGPGRALEARCSFYISQQCSFFNLLGFFLPQYNTPASCSACDPLHPPALFCRAAALPASPCIYLGFSSSRPVFAQLNLALVLVNTLLFFLALSPIYQDHFEL